MSPPLVGAAYLVCIETVGILPNSASFGEPSSSVARFGGSGRGRRTPRRGQRCSALLDEGGIDCSAYPYAHLVRGILLEDLGRCDEARAELANALGLARNAWEEAQIRDRLERLAIG
ncbi:MAG TPA: hypothetical protein VF881_19035 [Polyangiaceae bacterium]